jgi:wyosine [tRNA(Phe)-imidazoG37] synthetase (radical SAM superfamily)
MDNTIKIFGPVPSRRLGQSLGINNIQPKHCSYSCIYCQLGKTSALQVKRSYFYNPEKLAKEVEKKIRDAGRHNINIDYLTFVSDGEPTLDINLRKAIRLLKKTGIKIAVISNASLIGSDKLQDELCGADWVSLKIDAINEDVWRKMNRPHPSLSLSHILYGIQSFSHVFDGVLVTETMLIQNVNDQEEDINKLADYISRLISVKSYLSIPTRPPAEQGVKMSTTDTLYTVYQLFKEKNINVEYLVNYEGDHFGCTGNTRDSLLSIMSVHPMKEEAIIKMLKKEDGDKAVLDELVNENKLIKSFYKGDYFYLRNWQQK